MILIWLLTIIFLRLFIWINNGNKLSRKKNMKQVAKIKKVVNSL